MNLRGLWIPCEQCHKGNWPLAVSIWSFRRGVAMKEFRNLKVWEKAHSLTLAVYKATSGFPRQERFGLTSQMRRCSASIGANIAEGCDKRGNNEFQRLLADRFRLCQRVGLPLPVGTRLEIP